MKPIRVNGVKLILQYIFGITIILILLSIVKPPPFEVSNDVFHVLRISQHIYNNGLFFATQAASLLVDLTIVCITLGFGEVCFLGFKKLIKIISVFAPVIIEKYIEEEKKYDSE